MSSRIRSSEEHIPLTVKYYNSTGLYKIYTPTGRTSRGNEASGRRTASWLESVPDSNPVWKCGKVPPEIVAMKQRNSLAAGGEHANRGQVSTPNSDRRHAASPARQIHAPTRGTSSAVTTNTDWYAGFSTNNALALRRAKYPDRIYVTVRVISKPKVVGNVNK